MPLALDYRAPDPPRSHPKRIAVATAKWAVIGGLIAAVSMLLLHPQPASALPAAPVYLICLLSGGGDWGALIFILVGGFVLYGIYGLVTTLRARPRHRVAVGVVCALVHLSSALLCEMSRRGHL